MPASTSSPASIASRRIPRQTGGRRPPATATPTIAVVGSYGSASATVATTGTPSTVSPARSESTTATTGSDPYRMTP